MGKFNFRRPRFNSDFKSYFSHFRKGMLTILGMVLIAALIVGSFIYGNNERQREAEGNTQQTEQSVTQNEQATSEANQEPASSGSTASGNQSSGGSEERVELPNNGPEAVAATGPEDWLAPLAGAVIYLMYRKYRQSQRELSQAQLT